MPSLHRCFPHVVNRACQAVLAALTNMDLMADTAKDLDPDDIVAERDLIALVRTTVRTACNSFASF
jgi:hypothetical protein